MTGTTEVKPITKIKYTFEGRMDNFFDTYGTRLVSEVPRGGVVIDVGCSGGITTLELLRKFSAKEAIGIDFIDPRQIVADYPHFAPQPSQSESSKLNYMQGDMFHLSDLTISQADLIVFANNLLPLMMSTRDFKTGAFPVSEALSHLKDTGKIVLLQNGLGKNDLLFLKRNGNEVVLDMDEKEIKQCPFDSRELDQLLSQINH